MPPSLLTHSTHALLFCVPPPARHEDALTLPRARPPPQRTASRNPTTRPTAPNNPVPLYNPLARGVSVPCMCPLSLPRFATPSNAAKCMLTCNLLSPPYRRRYAAPSSACPRACSRVYPGGSKVSLSAFAFLFSEAVQYSRSRVESVSDLEHKLEKLGHNIGLRVLELISFREKGSRRETKLISILQVSIDSHTAARTPAHTHTPAQRAHTQHTHRTHTAAHAPPAHI